MRDFRSSRARLCVGHHITRVAIGRTPGGYGDLALSAEADRTVEAFTVRSALCHHAAPRGQ